MNSKTVNEFISFCEQTYPEVETKIYKLKDLKKLAKKFGDVFGVEKLAFFDVTGKEKMLQQIEIESITQFKETIKGNQCFIESISIVPGEVKQIPIMRCITPVINERRAIILESNATLNKPELMKQLEEMIDAEENFILRAENRLMIKLYVDFQ